MPGERGTVSEAIEINLRGLQIIIKSVEQRKNKPKNDK